MPGNTKETNFIEIQLLKYLRRILVVLSVSNSFFGLWWGVNEEDKEGRKEMEGRS